VTPSTWLAILSVLIAVAGIGGYVALVGVTAVRNHPELYVVACALAVVLAVLAVTRATGRRWPAWAALGVSSLLLVGTVWFNFVVTRVPDVPVAIRVGEAAPDFTLPDASGKPVHLADFRGKKPVVLVFYRGYW
jgi:cytochrome oxidase Cu insertion factor (SCO1/SenC/PrrC family)